MNPFRLVRGEWRYFVPGLLMALVIAVSTAVLPIFVVKPIYALVLKTGNYDAFLPLVLRAGALLVLASLALYVQDVIFGIGGERLGERLRRDVYASLLRAGVGLTPDRQALEAGPTSSGRAARTMMDVTALTSFFVYELGMTVAQGATVLANLIFLLYQNFALSFGLLFAFLPLVWGFDRIGRGIERAFRANQQAAEGASSAMGEGLQRIEAVKAFRLEAAVLERFRGPNQAQVRASVQRVRLSALHWPVSQAVIGLGVVLLLVYAIGEVKAGRLKDDAMIAYFTQLVTVIAPVQIFARLLARWTAMYEPARTIQAALDLPPEADPGHLVAPERWRGELELRGLVARYPGAPEPALAGIDLLVQAGESVAIVGPSGSGKTTLTRLLLRLLETESGQILLDGHDLREYSLNASRSAVALVPQQAQLFTGSLRENLLMARASASEADLWQALEAANLAEELRAMPRGLDTMLGENGAGISGGQAQRLSIARALLLRAPIIVLDEPTSALDAHSEAAIKRTLEGLRHTCTVIVIAHRLSTVESVDRIVVLEQGRVVQSGRHSELLEVAGAYQALVTAGQVGGA